MDDWPWGELGIEPDSGADAIRRAYARRLKAVDADADPQAFIALREARDAAERFASDVGASPWLGPLDDGGEVALPVLRFAAVTVPVPESPALRSAVRAVEELIRGTLPTIQIYAKVGTHSREILNSPAMESLECAEWVEQWAADLIAESGPRADALLAAALARFGWAARFDAWDCSPELEMVIPRYRDYLFLDALRHGQGPHALAYMLLRDPLLPPQLRSVPRVERLLAMLRAEHPAALADFAPDRLAAWDALIARRQRTLTGRVRRIPAMISARIAALWEWCARDQLRLLAVIFLGPFLVEPLVALLSPALGVIWLVVAIVWVLLVTGFIVQEWIRAWRERRR